MSQRWPVGTAVLLRFGRFGHARWVLPAVVVEDTPVGLAAWVLEGSPIVRGSMSDGSLLRQAPVDDRLLDAARSWRHDRWQGPGALLCFPAGKPWSIWWLYSPGGRLREIKGDLGEPVVRWRHAGLHGVDGSDHALDVMFDPSGAVALRDEAEFEAKIGRDGYWDSLGAERIRRAARELIEHKSARSWPFDSGYESFRPERSWQPIKAVPRGWDHPHRIKTWSLGAMPPI